MDQATSAEREQDNDFLAKSSTVVGNEPIGGNPARPAGNSSSAFVQPTLEHQAAGIRVAAGRHTAVAHVLAERDAALQRADKERLSREVAEKREIDALAALKAEAIERASAVDRATEWQAAATDARASYERAEQELRHEVEHLRSSVGPLEDRCQTMQQSLSWRLTKPLRAAVAWLPSFYHPLRRTLRFAYWIASFQLAKKLAEMRGGNQPADLKEQQKTLESVAVSRSEESPLARRLADAQRVPPGSARPVPTKYSPMISIVLPTYETPLRYLREVLQSVSDQSYDKWELCIVDDGSTAPHVAAVLNEAAARDARIRVAYAPTNGGVAAASQMALEMARGEYVAFLDHDDMLAPAALSAVVEMLRNDTGIDMVYSDHAMLTEEGELVSAALKPGWSPDFILLTNYIVHFKVIRRSLLHKIGGFSETLDLSQDIGLTLKIAEAGARVVHCPRLLYFWRMHATSVAVGTTSKPRIGFTGCATVNAYLQRNKLPAEAIWPQKFRSANVGAYKLSFPRGQQGRIAVVVLVKDGNFNPADITALVAAAGVDQPPQLHIVSLTADFPIAAPPDVQCHIAPDQAALDRLIGGFDCETLVFVSPNALMISPDWLLELVGYLAISDRIGAVGGKVLDGRLNVADGGVLLTRSLPCVGQGWSDNTDGYWFTGHIATNVEAVSWHLMATPKAAYQRAGGLPVFAYADSAGISYCLRLRQNGYRIVLNPWSKIVATRLPARSADLPDRLSDEFGQDCLTDRYYHPEFSADIPYQFT